MKKSLFTLIIVIIALIALSTNAFAASPSASAAKHNPAPNNGTPGARATENAADYPKGNKHTGKPEHFKGMIVSADADSITLDVGGSTVTVAISADTQIRIPGVKDPGSDALQAGLTASVFARPDSSGNLVAKFVQVIPGKPSKIHRVGIVTAYIPGASITILAHNGNSYTFQLTTDTKILPAERASLLAVGALVTLIAPRDPASTTPIAKGIVVHPAGSASGAFGTPTPIP